MSSGYHDGHHNPRPGSASADWMPSAGPSFDLLTLPHDILRDVLLQPGLGARELCRLEQTSHAVASLIADDDAWRNVFLRSRRCPALGQPSSWKSELSRREDWSRSWRQLGLAGTCSPHEAAVKQPACDPGLLSRCVVPPSRQKLRRLAMMMFPGGLNGTPVHSDVHIVDPTISECFASISAAIACAKPQDTILVAPGTYYERLEIDKPIDLIGVGPIGAVRIISVDGPVVQVSSGKVACRVAKLCLEQQAAEGAPMSGAVRVEGGAVLVLEECSVASASGHCIVIKGNDSCAYILHNKVHRAKGVGVLVYDHARGLVEDNDICANARAGVSILSGGNPVVRLNRIHDGQDSGVLVSERGRGRIEENDIFSNLRAGVAILREGAPFVARNRIFDGHDSGVLVCEQGKGSVIDNDIFSNHMAGVAIGHGGASTVKGNTIRDGSGGSLLCLSSQSKGLICANVIDQDPGAILQVPDGLLPEVELQVEPVVESGGGDHAVVTTIGVEVRVRCAIGAVIRSVVGAWRAHAREPSAAGCPR